VASAPYALVNAYRDILSVALGTNYSFPAADKLKELLANPEALAAAVKATSGASTSGSTSTAPAPTKATETAPAKPAKDEEDEDAGMGAGGLFGGDDDEDY